MKQFIPDYAFLSVTRLVNNYCLGNVNKYKVYMMQMYCSRFIDHVLVEMHNNTEQEKEKLQGETKKSTSVVSS